MALIQEISNGQPISDKKRVDQTNSTSKGDIKSASDTKSMFLKLLVAEMQYQDPMQPTDNSQYVQEMATLSQVESLQNMEKTITSTNVDNYVGKYVEITKDDGTKIEGTVDYVTTDESGKKKVSVNDNLYDAKYVTSVIDTSWYENNYMLNTLSELFSKLPSIDKVTAADEGDIKKAVDLYNSMSDDLKGNVDPQMVAALTGLFNKVNQIKEANEAAQKAAEEAAPAEEGIPAAEETEEAAETDPADEDIPDAVEAAEAETIAEDDEN